MISYELQQKSDVNASKNVSINGRQYIFDFPCDDTSICTDYVVRLPRGTYKFELYGASGGSARGKVSSYRYENKSCISEETVRLMHGNTECIQQDSIGGAGGYLSGTITLKHPTLSYFTIGGKGVFGYKPGSMTEEQNFQKDNMQPGGYGGGGSSSNYFRGTGSGGGQTAVKFIENDLWHRVLVSGAGGGCDDNNDDDGSGGSGGNLTAQGWFYYGSYVSTHISNSTFGFSFGQGEAARFGDANNTISIFKSDNADIAGAGGGWFGGFSSQNCHSGAGGGSSFALTKNAEIPPGNIDAYDEFYHLIDSKPYAFDLNSIYMFSNVIHVPGIWEGNGRLIITLLDFREFESCYYYYKINVISLFLDGLINDLI